MVLLVYSIRLISPHGIASDAGSLYDPHPMLTYKWDPDAPVEHRPLPQQNGSPFDLGPHPADPDASALPSPTPTTNFQNGLPGPRAQMHHVPGHEIWVYGGAEGFVEGFLCLLNSVLRVGCTVPTHFGDSRFKSPWIRTRC
jgi:hypothetical protein